MVSHVLKIVISFAIVYHLNLVVGRDREVKLRMSQMLAKAICRASENFAVNNDIAESMDDLEKFRDEDEDEDEDEGECRVVDWAKCDGDADCTKFKLENCQQHKSRVQTRGDISDIKKLCGINMNTNTRSGEMEDMYDSSPRIIGGANVTTFKFPYVVRICIKYKDRTFKTAGGVIYSNKFIITAAHVFDVNRSKPLVAPKDITILAGYKMVNGWPRHEQQKTAIYFVKHENYTTAYGQFDVALIELSSPLTINTHVKGILLPTKDAPASASGKFATVAGYGGFSLLSQKNDYLLQTRVPLFDFTRCKSVYNSPKRYLTDVQYCVGGVVGNGTCAGDAGGPVVITTEPTFLLGILSFSRGLCGSTSPQVLTRAWKIKNWIIKRAVPTRVINTTLPANGTVGLVCAVKPIVKPVEEKNVTDFCIGANSSTSRNDDVEYDEGEFLHSRIYGGTNITTTPNNIIFPYLVLLCINIGGRFRRAGGAIYNDRFIITAAHTLDVNTSQPRIKPSDIRVAAGYFILNQKPAWEQGRGGKMFLKHANWSIPTAQNDIALIELSVPLKLSPRVRPIQLPTKDVPTSSQGKFVTVSGFGLFRPNSTSAKWLQTLKSPLVDFATCQRRYASDGKRGITEKQLCFGGVVGAGPCHGDSGGPVVITTEPNVLVGIISYGRQACGSDYPSIGTRVFAFADWIQEHTSTVIDLGPSNETAGASCARNKILRSLVEAANLGTEKEKMENDY